MREITSINLDLLASEIGIDKEAVAELLEIYCGEMDGEMSQVKALAEACNWQGLQRTVHNIKGVSANLYLQDMFKVAEELDHKLKRDDHENIGANVQALQETFEGTISAIQKTLSVYKNNLQDGR